MSELAIGDKIRTGGERDAGEFGALLQANRDGISFAGVGLWAEWEPDAGHRQLWKPSQGLVAVPEGPQLAGAGNHPDE